MKHSEQINEIVTALSKAQGEIKSAKMDATNPHFRSKYSNLSDIVEAAREALTKNELAVIQGSTRISDNEWVLVTKLAHKSGQWFESEFPLLAKDHSAQAMGSALTYAKRYSFASMVGVVSHDEDDDGESAMGRGQSKPTKLKPSTPSVNVTPKLIPNGGLNAVSDQQRKTAYSIASEAFNSDAEIKAKWTELTQKESSKDWTSEDYKLVIESMMNMPKKQKTLGQQLESEFRDFESSLK